MAYLGNFGAPGLSDRYKESYELYPSVQSIVCKCIVKSKNANVRFGVTGLTLL